MIAKTYLKKMRVELRTKTDNQLQYLLNSYKSKLENSNIENKNSVNQIIELIEQEISLRQNQECKEI